MECIIRLFTLFLLKKYSCFHKNRLCFHQNQQELDTDINIHVWVLSEILGLAMNSVVSATMEIDTAAGQLPVDAVQVRLPLAPSVQERQPPPLIIQEGQPQPAVQAMNSGSPPSRG
jgi:hypothetical protein